MTVGDKAPDFSLMNQDDETVSLKQLAGKWVILYFYPKDNTSGCTVEAQEFTAFKKAFEKMDAVILGVSPDSTKSHRNFIGKKELGITLLSDPDHQLIEACGAWQLKRNYGREYYGVMRSTVLIDPEGKIAHIWPKVKAKGHAEMVKAKLEELK
jgi:peroxiredoxin Q/BCP